MTTSITPQVTSTGAQQTADAVLDATVSGGKVEVEGNTTVVGTVTTQGLGTAGSPSGGVETVQGVAGGADLGTTDVNVAKVVSSAGATAPTSDLLVGGENTSGNLAPIHLDSSNVLEVDVISASSVGTPTSTAPTKASLIGAVDSSGNLQDCKLDNLNRLMVGQAFVQYSATTVPIAGATLHAGAGNFGGFFGQNGVGSSAYLMISDGSLSTGSLPLYEFTTITTSGTTVGPSAVQNNGVQYQSTLKWFWSASSDTYSPVAAASNDPVFVYAL